MDFLAALGFAGLSALGFSALADLGSGLASAAGLDADVVFTVEPTAPARVNPFSALANRASLPFFWISRRMAL